MGAYWGCVTIYAVDVAGIGQYLCHDLRIASDSLSMERIS